jgi:hypothetical protein
MNINDFRDTLSTDAPPDELSHALRALWYDASGDWDAAHGEAQEQDDLAGAWVHAYLHRKEGDLANAGYWYRRAGQPVAHGALEDEWAAIAETLLAEERS